MLFLPLLFSTLALATPCNDGWESPSSGSGTCSHHGGVYHGSYYVPPVYVPPVITYVPRQQVKVVAPTLDEFGCPKSHDYSEAEIYRLTSDQLDAEIMLTAAEIDCIVSHATRIVSHTTRIYRSCNIHSDPTTKSRIIATYDVFDGDYAVLHNYHNDLAEVTSDGWIHVEDGWIGPACLK